MAAITRSWWTNTASWCGKSGARRRRRLWLAPLLLRVQIFLDAADNVGSGAVQSRGSMFPWEGRTWTRPPGAIWRPPGKRCLCRGRTWRSAGLSSRLTVSPSIGLLEPWVSSLLPVSFFSPAFLSLPSFPRPAWAQGKCSPSASGSSRPMRSVKTASASLGSVTTWNTCSLVSRFARYWSSPRLIGIRYTECTSVSSAPPKRAATAEKQQHSNHRSMITRRAGKAKSRPARALRSMYKGQSITVIIPCLNEEQGIEQVLRAMPDFVDEVIVVDNASTDRTSEVAARYGRQSDSRGGARLWPRLQARLRGGHRRPHRHARWRPQLPRGRALLPDRSVPAPGCRFPERLALPGARPRAP